jgi:hypothetical protein
MRRDGPISPPSPAKRKSTFEKASFADVTRADRHLAIRMNPYFTNGAMRVHPHAVEIFAWRLRMSFLHCRSMLSLRRLGALYVPIPHDQSSEREPAAARLETAVEGEAVLKTS